MIKRPLIWILAAYLVGLFLAWQKFSILLVIIFIFLILFVIYLLMFQIKNKIINSSDRFLWSLPFLLLTGFLAMNGQLKKPELYGAFDQEVPCELTGTITMIVEKQKGFSLYVSDNTIYLMEDNPYLMEDSPYLCEKIVINYLYDQNAANNTGTVPDDYLVGNSVSVKGILQKFQAARNPGGFNEQLYYQIENIDFKLEAKQITVTDTGFSRYQAVLGRIKNRLMQVYASSLSDKEAGTLIAMLLGEKYLLDDEIKKLYQENGISHVLAISGLHVSLIGMLLFGILKRIKCPITLATFFTIFFIYSYGVLTNFSVSTNRAVVMMVVFLLSPLAGKTYDMLSGMSLSALIILLQNPMQILSAGFLLSFGAVIGIATIFPLLKQLFPSKNSFVNGFLISISAQVATTPFIIYYFYQFPVYSIIINIIILPLITILTITSILAGITGAIYMPLGVFLIGGANYILKFYEWMCRIGSSLPGNLITVGKPDPLRLLLYVLVFVIFIWVTRRYQKKSGVMLLAAALLLLMLPKRNAGLEVTFLDVGQGDAIYMESGGGTAYLIDGGSADVKKVGTYRLLPFLMSQGTDVLDYALVTHADSDHISGLIELIGTDKIKIRNLILPDISKKDDAYLELEILAQKNGIAVQYIKAGDKICDGAVRITCLHPASGYRVLNSNSYSTVLSVSYGRFDMLLTGDLQKDGEKLVTNLLDKQEYWAGYEIIPAKDYDILKVAHHGSKSSTLEEFITLTKPEIAIISCGKDNFYGHPHAELLDRLEAAGSNIKITYETGAVTVKTDGVKVEVSEYIDR